MNRSLYVCVGIYRLGFQTENACIFTLRPFVLNELFIGWRVSVPQLQPVTKPKPEYSRSTLMYTCLRICQWWIFTAHLNSNDFQFVWNRFAIGYCCRCRRHRQRQRLKHIQIDAIKRAAAHYYKYTNKYNQKRNNAKQYEKWNKRTWNTCAKRNKYNCCNGILYAQRTAKMGCNITDYSGHNSNRKNGYNKANVTTVNIYKRTKNKRKRTQASTLTNRNFKEMEIKLRGYFVCMCVLSVFVCTKEYSRVFLPLSLFAYINILY